MQPGVTMGKQEEDIIIPDEAETAQFGGDAASTEDTSPAATAESPINQLRRERDEYKDKYLRAQAETINTSRRLQQQHTTALKLAAMDLARELLPIVDNLDRTLASLDHLSADDPVTKGVRLIADDFGKILKNHGIVPIEAVGTQFDPAMHEALMHDPDTTAPPGTVTRELERGYMMHDRVLRPARVAVSAADSGNGERDST